ncbi:unnamed protein product [Parascedosporium putredinis]|uniref:Protein kinase domain-containing protein n=1 Tax=Parascedosporium putredinis TaxID=1442378 RepID=A0A9P1MAI9_9PEZI|nr:unnamed protein product [Parascedosporium putredinis]CAI7994230.1 unnamed protein product [Parascedosporium putredinis]
MQALALSEVPPNRGSGGRTTENILHIGGRFEHDSVKPQQEPLWNSDLVNYEGKHEEGNEATASGLDGLTLVEMFEFTLPKDSESRRPDCTPVSDLSDENVSGRQFKRVLASLILTRKADCIFDFVDHGLDDRKLCEAEFSLPDQDVMLEDEGYLQDLYKGYPGPCQDPEVWSREDIRNLRRVRWEVSPVFFTIERGDAPESTSVRYKIVHYELRSAEETLPFGKTDIVPKTNGAFSSFEFYTINPHQQNFHRYTLLATFEVVGKSAPSKYHFMFEAADGTILTLWESEKEWKRIKSRSQTGRIEVARWVARQCHGLAEGLSQFHKFSKFHDDPNPKTKGMHGDIKPDNILWYKGWIPGNSGPLSVQATDSPETSDEDDLGVLQLADFGLSSFHSTGTVHNVISSNDFLDYAAPETEGWLRHPPPADVWQLGCLFLDFVTWLPMEETTMHVNHASNLYNSKHSSSFVRDVINLVINRMLVVEPFDCLNQHQYPEKTKATCRISSSVASEILGGMLDMGNRSENYFQPSSVEKSVEYSKEPIVIKTTLKQMRQDVLDRSRENTENLEMEQSFNSRTIPHFRVSNVSALFAGLWTAPTEPWSSITRTGPTIAALIPASGDVAGPSYRNRNVHVAKENGREDSRCDSISVRARPWPYTAGA